ncbi:perlucin-like protein isoform X5 [Acropora millepora]|uniref:perlucin-like protein isoform X5 n=1 Tax=Acropora millepora TaxID=45264 RepID=UPI001CF29611|nr:perlucin-like protein isoform X5 [Acropora millepora]
MKFLFVVVLLVCTNLLFSQRGNAITGPQGCGTTSKSEAVNIHVHCSAQEEGQKGEKETPCDCGSPSADKSSAEVQEPSCSTGWVQHGKSCYIVIDIPTAEWGAARRNCLKFGGDLAKITRDDENQFLYNLIGNQTYTPRLGVWLGLHRKADDKFYWTDGTLLAGYNKWAPGEPNNPSTERCGHLYGKSDSSRQHWNDIRCKITGSYVVQAPVILCQKALK